MSNFEQALMMMKLELQQKLAALEELRQAENLTPLGLVDDSDEIAQPQPGHLELMRAIKNFQLSKMLALKAPTLQEMMHPGQKIVNPEVGGSSNFIPITNEVIRPDRLIIERRKQSILNQTAPVMNLSDSVEVISFKKSKEKIGLVLKEFKNRKLKSGSGKTVTNRKQALAIALSEMRKGKKK